MAEPDTVDALLELNHTATAAQMQRICARYRRVTDDPEPGPDFFSLRADGQRWRVDGSLGAADGAVLQQSLRAKRDQLFHHTGQPASAVDALLAPGPRRQRRHQGAPGSLPSGGHLQIRPPRLDLRLEPHPPGWMRRMLRARHPTCSFPGCQAAGYLEAHHTTHYEYRRDAGVDDLVLLCAFHHRQLHTHGGRVGLGVIHDHLITHIDGQ